MLTTATREISSWTGKRIILAMVGKLQENCRGPIHCRVKICQHLCSLLMKYFNGTYLLIITFLTKVDDNGNLELYGFEWAAFRLGVPGSVCRIDVDTTAFKVTYII